MDDTRTTRVLEASRLSKLADRTGTRAIGLARRSEEVARYCAAYGLDLVGVAEDTDVSGSTDPFGRPELGRWLAHPEAFDLIMANDLDRVGRNARHLLRLRDWCEDTGHKLVILSPHLEWPPGSNDLASPVIWDVLGRLAEYELNAITKRNRETQEWLRKQGALVGKPMYGYRVTGDRKQKTLEIDPVTGAVVREAADKYLRGETLEAIADNFNARGTPSPNPPTAKHPNPKWSARVIGQLLRSESIIGRRTQGDRVLRYEGIITVAEHKAIVARLDSRAHRRGVSQGNTAMLTSAIYCGNCDKAMYRIKGRQGMFAYYCRNRDCPDRLWVPMMDADMAAMQAVNKLLGNTPVMTSRVIPGHDYEDEIDQLKLDLAALDPESDDFLDQVTQTQAEIRHLRSLPVEPAREISVPAVDANGNPLYVADVFADADTLTRRGILLRSGIRFYATRKDGGGYHLRMEARNTAASA